MTLVEKARVYVGIKEIGKNRGFALKDESQRGFELTMRNSGWTPGLSWCAFFVKVCALGALGEEYAKWITGGVIKTFSDLKKSPKWEFSAAPKVGSVVFWDTGNGHGHCGIVISVPSIGNIVTIEGNTNASGSSDGDGVYIKQRLAHVDKQNWKLLGYFSPINEDNTTSVQPG